MTEIKISMIYDFTWCEDQFNWRNSRWEIAELSAKVSNVSIHIMDGKGKLTLANSHSDHT